MKYAHVDKVDTSRGAPMGRKEWNDVPGHDHITQLAPLKMADGYDDGGAYWGLPDNVWKASYHCAMLPGKEGQPADVETGTVYVRANSFAEAVEFVHSTPGWENAKIKEPTECPTYRKNAPSRAVSSVALNRGVVPV